MRVAGTICAFLVSGCVGTRPQDPVVVFDAGADGGDRPLDSGDRPRDGGPVAPDAFDPRCHWDCFGGTYCQAGEVRGEDARPIPCAEWTGACPYTVLGRCPGACADTPPVLGLGNWALWCEGSEESRAGDPCAIDDDCQPPAPEITPETVVRRYLACDESLGECVEVPPPEVIDFGAACSVSFDALSSPDGYALGAASDAACSSGWCLFLAAEPPGCDRHGCAVVCEDDWDCPPELDCTELEDWTGRDLVDGSRGTVRLCFAGWSEPPLACH